MISQHVIAREIKPKLMSQAKRNGLIEIASVFGLAMTFFLIPESLTAGVITEDFSTITQLNSSSTTAIWNLAEGKLHVPFIIDRDPSGGGETEDDVVHQGTATDGAFNNSTNSSFDSDAPSTPTTITLDTSKTYQFTSFTLSQGYTLKGTGSAVLLIRVQGDVQIDGTIDLSGTDGTEVSVTTTDTPSGGTSCCGGGAGGDGGQGSTSSTGSNGTSGDAGDSGRGQGGVASAGAGNGSGGGGGGGFSDVTTAATGETPSGGGAGGAAGSDYSDAFIGTFVGGSGGGGGGGL